MSLDYDGYGEVLTTTSLAEGQVLVQTTELPAGPEPDDRFPGSFFRVPGIPSPGRTAWSLSE